MIFGYFLFLSMGITLGLIGAGGSILTIPILIYWFNIPPMLATTYSLFIVGISALFGALRYRSLIVKTKGLLFAGPSVLGVFVSRFYILPSVPSVFFGVRRDTILMSILAIIMFFAGYFMLRNNSNKKELTTPKSPAIAKVILAAALSGLIMGIVGVGGGFLIVPAIVFFLNIDMKEAVATSLFIITLNSSMGFLADQNYLSWADYERLLLFATLSLIGLFVGISLNKRIESHLLKKVFGWFVLLLAVFIGVKEIFI